MTLRSLNCSSKLRISKYYQFFQAIFWKFSVQCILKSWSTWFYTWLSSKWESPLSNS